MCGLLTVKEVKEKRSSSWYEQIYTSRKEQDGEGLTGVGESLTVGRRQWGAIAGKREEHPLGKTPEEDEHLSTGGRRRNGLFAPSRWQFLSQEKAAAMVEKAPSCWAAVTGGVQHRWRKNGMEGRRKDWRRKLLRLSLAREGEESSLGFSFRGWSVPRERHQRGLKPSVGSHAQSGPSPHSPLKF